MDGRPFTHASGLARERCCSLLNFLNLLLPRQLPFRLSLSLFILSSLRTHLGSIMRGFFGKPETVAGSSSGRRRRKRWRCSMLELSLCGLGWIDGG